MTKTTFITQDTIEEPMDVCVLPNIKDQAAPPATTGKDIALVHKPARDKELEEEIHIELAGTLIKNKLCVETTKFGLTIQQIKKLPKYW